MNTNEQHIIDELKKGTTPLPDDAYFAQLKGDVLAKIPSEPAKVVPLYRKWWMVASAAASILLIVTLFLRGGENVTPTHTAPDWASVSREEVLSYIHDNIDDFEAEAIAAHLDSLPDWDPQLQVASADTLSVAGLRSRTKTKQYDQLFNDIDRQDILEYLDEEAIELDDELFIGS